MTQLMLRGTILHPHERTAVRRTANVLNNGVPVFILVGKNTVPTLVRSKQPGQTTIVVGELWLTAAGFDISKRMKKDE